MSSDIKVLIVDDDTRNIRILEEILSDDFILETAADGETALQRVAAFMPDIILLDVMMPGIDGLEVCRQIRQHEDYRYIKIILVSGKAMLEERLEGYEAGSDDYITKPFDHMELLAKVNVYAKLKTIEEVDRLKTDFLSLISHETGTPLNAVTGFSSLLLSEEGLSSEHREMVQEILDAGKQLHEKVDRILLLSSLKKATPYPTDELSVEDLIDTAMAEMADAAAAEGITLEKQGDREVLLSANFELLKKALKYLLENAIKYSPEGGSVALRWSVSADGGRCAIQVKDSGPGIVGMDPATLFQEFGVADIKRHGAGMGISLALTKRIVERHGGAVSAENDADGGAIVTLSVPLRVQGGAEAPLAAQGALG